MTTPLITDAELLAMGIASNALGAIPSAERDAARGIASSFALSYLQKRFVLPLLSWSDDVKRATAHVCSYDLLTFRGFNPNLGADDSLEKRYANAVQWLRDVARGIVEPEAVVGSAPPITKESPLLSTDVSRWGNYGNR